MLEFKKCILFLLLIIGWNSSFAQFYPTQYRPTVDWQQLSTAHFNVVFPAGEDSAAYETARLLEKHYHGVQQLVGGTLSEFPFILTNYNDRSNGFVTSLHFRSEIDIPPHKGKLLNPKTGNWLENVVPHELVHALQFNHLGKAGLGQLVSIFSPDLARSIHGATPSGIREGLATYYESHSVAPGGGRGNYAYFNNQFDAVFQSPKRWSMGQTVHVSDYSRPFNRIYLGGYTFTDWLQQTYGLGTSHDAIEFNIRWPFLGYGFALKHATNKWPSQLYDEFEKDTESKLAKAESIGKKELNLLPLSFKGAEIRRPKWLSDSTLIFHGSFYNAEAGFYSYSLNTQDLTRLISTRSVSDYNYALSNDGKTLIYSYFDADLINTNAFKATLVKTSVNDKSTQSIVQDRRLYSPTLSGDSLLIAVETHRKGSRLSEIKLTNRSVNSFFADPSHQITDVALHPNNPGSLAIVINQNGNQALWLTSKEHIESDLKSIPEIYFPAGSVFDPAWHPDGNRLLFSSDFSGKLQIYEYVLKTKSITRLTNARYNAFEASYSPDGNRIAFIIQQGNEQLPAVLSRDEFDGKEISTSPKNLVARPPNSVKDTLHWTRSSYSTGFSWLKPRTVLPAFEEVSGSDGDAFQIGAGLHSSDLLQQQAYSLEATVAEGRFWYDAIYQNRTFFPGFKARIFSDPAFRRFQFEPEEGDTFIQTFLRQERSFALSVPVSFTLKQNVDFTSLFIEPEIRQSQLRYFNSGGSNPSDFSSATIGNVFAQLNYKLQQDIRAVQPNSGVVLYSEIEHFFRSTGVTLNTIRGETRLNFSSPTALRSGLFGYISPLRRWNQSLRIGLESITQTNRVFDNQFLVSDGFLEDLFPFANNVLSLSTRYTIPLVYPDNGGLLLPLYLSSIYLSAFSNTVTDPAAANPWNNSRTVIGGGLRFQFRISNLSIDIGAGFGYEPSRSSSNFFIGNF